MCCYRSAVSGKIQKFEEVNAGNISREKNGPQNPLLLLKQTLYCLLWKKETLWLGEFPALTSLSGPKVMYHLLGFVPSQRGSLSSTGIILLFCTVHTGQLLLSTAHLLFSTCLPSAFFLSCWKSKIIISVKRWGNSTKIVPITKMGCLKRNGCKKFLVFS